MARIDRTNRIDRIASIYRIDRRWTEERSKSARLKGIDRIYSIYSIQYTVCNIQYIMFCLKRNLGASGLGAAQRPTMQTCQLGNAQS